MKTLENKSLHFSEIQPSGREKCGGTWLRVGVLLLLLTGAAGMAQGVLGLHSASEWSLTLLCGAAFGIGMVFALQAKGSSRWPAAVIPAAVIGFCLIFAGTLWPSAAEMMNRILARVQIRQARICLPFISGDASPLWGQLTVSAAVSILTALTVLYAGGFGWLLCFACWLAVGKGYLDASVWLMLFCLGCTLLPLTALRRCGGKADAQTTVGLLIMTALVAAVALGAEQGTRAELSPLRNRVTAAVHRLRYESAEQPLAEGHFATGESKTGGDETMLEVQMDTPDSLYLRGMTGELYGEDGWSLRTGETAAEEAGRFYWLESNGFFRQMQLSTLADVLGASDGALQAEITVKGACRERLYLPPELESSDLIDALSLLDGMVYAPGLSGADSYTFTTKANLVARADELLELLEERQNEPEVADYLNLEWNYRTFVYENYLEVPQDCEEILKAVPELAAQPAASYDARFLVRSVLSDCTKYSRSAGFSGGGSGLLRDLLAGKPANSAQYATAAVLMLRMLGVPARYAEGYLITPDQAAGAAEGQPIVLTGQDAHAWAEYYEDGIGWIPFETVPDYIGRMEEAGWQRFHMDEEAVLEAESQQTEPEQTELEEPEETFPPVTTPEEDIASQWDSREPTQLDADTASKLPLRLLWIPLLLCVLLVLCLIVRRKKILQVRNAEFDHPDLSVAISALFSHSMALMQHSGLRLDNSPLARQSDSVAQWFGAETAFGSMRILNEEALFSDHTLEEAQRSEMRAYEELTLAEFKKKLSWRKRMYQQWICCMY